MPPRQTFPKSRRLQHRLQFSAVYEAKTRESRGPLTIYAATNSLDRLRLGLSVARHVGTAPCRNRIKRLLREAFRLQQHELPPGLDLIVVVRPHEPLRLKEYQDLLASTVRRLHTTWQRRRTN